MLQSPAVEIAGLVKRYDGRAVVDGLDLVARHGAVTAVLGPNGAGKTTTVECCEGLRVPDAGRVRVLGLDPSADAAALRPRVGVMLQDGGLPTGARAAEMLRHVAAMYAHPRDVGELAERLGLGSFARTTVRRLSGGQRQRLALAAAVVGRPELVFLDEPSAGMDPQSRRAVWDLVRELRDEGVAVVLTTHLMDEAESLADHVAVVDHGHVIAQGAVRDLLTSHDDRTLRFSAPAGLDTTALEDALATAPPAALAGPPAGPLPDALAAVAGPPARPSSQPHPSAAGTSAGRAEGVGVREVAPGDYTVTGPVDPHMLATLTAWCADRGVLAHRITVGRRTLEDVFLDLTGRDLR